jgi:hypothetical protein
MVIITTILNVIHLTILHADGRVRVDTKLSMKIRF